MYKTITIYEGQTLPDIAVQEYGCYEGVFTIMDDNDLNIDTLITAGMKVKIRTEIPEITDTNKQIAAQLALGKQIVSSGIVIKKDDYVATDYVVDDYVE